MIYLREFTRVARTALSMWNREPSAPGFGSFDRSWWGWKKKDMPDATLQYGARLVVEHCRLVGRVEALPDWLEGFTRFCERYQLRDGSFDQVYPFERSPGVIYDFLAVMLFVARCPELKERSRLEGVIDRALAFALRHDEHHGEIANHLAEYAFELLHAARELSHEGARRKGMEYLERTLKLYVPSEGWFREYDGPDPGYQTRTLRYLVKCTELLEDTALWQVVEQAAGFVGQALLPDGTLHPMLGVRSTALLYPAAFEKLATRNSELSNLAARVRRGWQDERVPLPSQLDFENAVRLADDALEAYRSAGELPEAVEPTGRVHLPEAGLVVWREPERTVHVATKLGGPVVVCTKTERWEIAAEEAGYLLESKQSCALSRMPGSGEVTRLEEDRVEVSAGFFASLHDELDPWRFVVLRILNLTLLRSGFIGELFKKIVVRRLMTGRRRLKVQLVRKVALKQDSVVISDELKDDRPHRPSGERLWRCRRLVGIHMASSRYFQAAELEGGSWRREVEWTGPVCKVEIDVG